MNRIDLQIIEVAAGRCKVIARTADGNQTSELLDGLPTKSPLLRVLGTLANLRRSPTAPEAEKWLGELMKFGEGLYDALFHASIREMFARAMAGETDVHLRIDLSEAGALAMCPWELLRHPSDQQFLLLKEGPPIALTRLLASMARRGSRTRDQPLRLLAVLPRYEGGSVPNVEAEWKRLENLRTHAPGRFEIDRLEPATWKSLCGALNAKSYDVLHFGGHGSHDPDQNRGWLLLEPTGDHDGRVGSEGLADALEQGRARDLQVVVLNACEGGSLSGADSSFAFNGVAQILTRRGLPAVVAVQHRITDDAATVFAECFYAALADRRSINAAMQRARSQMRQKIAFEDLQWASPVLYLQGDGGAVQPRPRASTSARVTYRDPLLLKLCCNRSDQVSAMVGAIERHCSTMPQRPLAVVVHGDELEVPGAFVERVETEVLPDRGKTVSRWRLKLGLTPARHDVDMMEPLRRLVGAGDGFSSGRSVGANCGECRAILVDVPCDSSHWQGHEERLLPALRSYLADLPDVEPGVLFVCMVTIRHPVTPQVRTSAGWLRRLFPNKAPSIAKAGAMRSAIARSADVASDGRTGWCVLEELPRVFGRDVRDWDDKYAQLQLSEERIAIDVFEASPTTVETLRRKGDTDLATFVNEQSRGMRETMRRLHILLETSAASNKNR